MTNEDVLNDMLRKTFPNVIFIRSINEGNKTRAIHFSEQWLEEEYKEPKTGHWEWVQYDYNPKLGNWHCSECRCIVVECVDKEEKGGIPLYKYCPQCGAKMIEPQEREDKECAKKNFQ